MGSKSSKNQTTTATPWAPQGDQLQTLFDEAAAWLQQGGAQAYQGPGVAQQNQTQQAAADMATGNVDNLNQQAQTAITANQGLFNASDVGNNPVVQTAIQSALNPLAKTFTDQVLPSLRIGGIDGGSSSRQGVLEANALNDFGVQSSNLVGQLMGDFYNKGLAAETRALSLAPELQNMTNAGAQTLAGVGDAEQMFQQLLLNDQMGQFNTQQNQPMLNLANFKNLITGGFGGTTTSPTGQSGAGQLGGAIGAGASTYGALGGPANPYAAPIAGGVGLLSYLG